MLLVTPSLTGIGGVQASARTAWETLSRLSTAGQGARLFCYDRGVVRQDRGAADVVHAQGRLSAVLKAVTMGCRSRGVLVWHLDLLKLVPFFRLRDARVIVFLHGIEAWRAVDPLTRRILRRVDLFLVNSDFTWQRFVAANPDSTRAPHVTVNLGVDEPVRSVVPPPDGAVALVLSRLDRREDYKGHHELLSAWLLVLVRIPVAELWIVGDGDLRADLERMVRERSLAAHVRFFGQVSEEEKKDLLTRARCLALPSRGEGFGLVYLEAMRLSRPCLVSTLDAGREVVNPPDAGLAADPDNPRDLAEAISRLLTPGPEWDAWSRQARARYESRFTARHFQERLIAALESLGHGAVHRPPAPAP